MASASPFNFDNIMPGLDFLKQFAAAGGAPGMPQAAQWVTPTLDPKELEKRIQELKSVQFWLDQNAKALSATIQALEVQRMTLSTLQSMNVGFADVAAAMGGKTAKAAAAPGETTSANPAAVDPMQWWGAIGQQFQTIASQAVADMQKHANSFAADMAAPASASPASATKPRATRPRKTAPASNARPAAKPRAKPGKAKS